MSRTFLHGSNCLKILEWTVLILSWIIWVKLNIFLLTMAILIQNTLHTFTICYVDLSSWFRGIVRWTFYTFLLQISWLIFSNWTKFTNVCCFVAICSLVTYSWNQTVLWFTLNLSIAALLTFKVRDNICKNLLTKGAKLLYLTIEITFSFLT